MLKSFLKNPNFPSSQSGSLCNLSLRRREPDHCPQAAPRPDLLEAAGRTRGCRRTLSALSLWGWGSP